MLRLRKNKCVKFIFFTVAYHELKYVGREPTHWRKSIFPGIDKWTNDSKMHMFFISFSFYIFFCIFLFPTSVIKKGKTGGKSWGEPHVKNITYNIPGQLEQDHKCVTRL